MKDKYFYYGTIILLLIICFINYSSSNSYAYEYVDHNYNLFYKDNKDELSKDVRKYLNDINKYIFRNSNYEVYDSLVDNYDFLTYFAIDYILDNYEYYKKGVVQLDNYSYFDKYNNKKTTNQYINSDIIYGITYKYFGVRDYAITNSNFNVIDNYVSLSRYTDDSVDMIIKNLSIDNIGEYIIVNVTYVDNSNYSYKFYIKDNVLRLYNIEV